MAAAADGYAEIDPTGRYGRFNEVLGKGSMKTVYRAFDELNGMEVAWNQEKVYDVVRSPERVELMYSEINLLGALEHESIIRFYTSWVDYGTQTFNFITEMFTSGTLREYRQRYRQVDIRAVKSWARQILHGLIYLHGHDPPVIHRDLKCDNIFVNGHLGQVKIGDLGLAAVLQDSQSARSIIGTPEFMAPELYEEEYNELVDIYSFGMCVLEMLTAEYPYTECSNRAQIYRKVTSGRRPDAFHRIQNLDAKRFIGRCLEKASNRSSARELLLDPFLYSDEHCLLTISEMPELSRDSDMTITGKMNPEDDTIFLSVQIADRDGHARNIYFPFDIVNDTPIEVANEMVSELEIIHREPSDIADVIAQEITHLVPDWKIGNPPVSHQPHQIYSYTIDREDNELNHPFHYLSSPASSYVSDFHPGSYQQGVDNADWIRDDDSSSLHSGMFSATYYQQDNLPSLHRAKSIPQDHNSTEGSEGNAMLPTDFGEQCDLMPPRSSQTSESHERKKASSSRQLSRNKSMIDTRNRLLNRTLIEGFKNRLFKTVGAIEHIGFRAPFDDRSGKSPPSRGDKKKHGS